MKTNKVKAGRILLFTIMLAGLILALCSLASISYMDSRNEPKTLVILRFDTTMRNAMSPKFYHNAQINGFDSAISRMWNQYNAFIDNKIVGPRDLSPNLRRVYNQIADSMDNTIMRHLILLSRQAKLCGAAYKTSFKKQQDMVTQMEIKFREQSVVLPPSLLAKYGESLISYLISLPYENDINQNYQNLNANNSALFQTLKIADSRLRTLATNLKVSKDSNFDGYSPYLGALVLPREEDFNLISSTGMVPQEIPNPPRAGEDWGFFFNAIYWLVGANNLDLLVLIGMLGFALFGASITIYVTRDLNHAQISISQSITLTLVRGFSAAIIVFLSMRGGIAVINGGESNPNPMILFLFCFIGAVFSEPIWKWASGRVTGNFPGDMPLPMTNHKITIKEPEPEIKLTNPDLTESANKPFTK